MKKYIVVSGQVFTSDHGVLIVSAEEVMRRYGVNPADCIIAKHQQIPFGISGEFTVLRPDPFDLYILPEPVYIGVKPVEKVEKPVGKLEKIKRFVLITLHFLRII